MRGGDFAVDTHFDEHHALGLPVPFYVIELRSRKPIQPGTAGVKLRDIKELGMFDVSMAKNSSLGRGLHLSVCRARAVR